MNEQNEPMRKICPLMTWRFVDPNPQNPTSPYVFCYRDNCAWWDGKACCMTKITYMKDATEALQYRNDNE